MLAKLVLKVAAKAPLKALASKAAGGAVAGAAAGSVLPGAGTVAGAVAGTVIGITTGISIDGALLEIEEALSRDDFRREIVTAIREARRDFEDEYLGPTHAPISRFPVTSPGPPPRGSC